jgi:fructokinase
MRDFSAMNPSRALLGGVELGGTKCVCILGSGPDDIRAQAHVPTTDPEATLAQIRTVLDHWHAAHGPLKAVGLASFGPLELRPHSPRYGEITSSAKPGWAGTNLIARLIGQSPLPVGFNTDVNAAALAEGRWGAARNIGDYAYVTVGTGIGVGLVVAGRLVSGCNHTELGHVRVVRHPGDDWAGSCSYHGDCVEGLASGPAIAARMGMLAREVPSGSPIWELVAHPLGQLLQAILLATAPRRILIGGGVMQHRPELLALTRQLLVRSMNGYLDLEELTGGMEHYVVAPGLGPLSGPLGALALAADAAAGPAAAVRD